MLRTAAPRLTALQWLICAIAGLGFAFDLYETLILPLILRPALSSLGHLSRGTPEFNHWAGVLLFIPSATGGLVALFGGFLMDTFGRRRVLTWSILLYGLAACLAACSRSLTELLVLRCVTLIGIYVEYVAGVAWLAELFDHPAQRERVLGYTQACFNLGGLMVTGAYLAAVAYADRLPAIVGSHEPWRYTLLTGLVPAIPLLIVRPLLPESAVWRQRKAARALGRPSITELFSPGLRRTSLSMMLLVAASFALPYGAIQQTAQMIHDLPDLHGLVAKQLEQTIGAVQFVQEIGGIIGRIAFALIVTYIASQRRMLYALAGACLIAFSWLYFFGATRGLIEVEAGLFIASLLFNALHSFWGNLTPRVFPTRLRGTGESFALNVGGRTLGVSAAVFTAQLANVMPAATAGARLAYSAGTVAALACLAVLLGCRYLPEPASDSLPA